MAGSSRGVFVLMCSAPYLGLRRNLGGKPDDNWPTRRDGVGQRVGAACCPNKVGSSGCDLHGASEELVRVEVGHTGRGVGRRPCASLQQAVRTSFLRTIKVGLKQRFRHQNPQLRHAAPDSIRLTVKRKYCIQKVIYCGMNNYVSEKM